MKKTILTVTTICVCATLCGAVRIVTEKLRTHVGGVDAIKRVSSVRQSAAAPFDVPFVLDPTQDDVARMTVLDSNGDGVKWKYDAKDNGSLTYAYHSNHSADDWVFIPVTALPGENAYTLEFRYRTAGNYEESFKFCIGDTPAPGAMTRELWKKEKYIGASYKTEKIQFTASDSQLKYIGIKAYSSADQYGIYLKDIGLGAVDSSLPLAPVITSSGISGLDYSANVRMPSETVTGAGIEGTLGLEISVDGDVRRNLVSCQPGQTVEVRETLSKGLHQIRYRAFADANGLRHFSDPVSESVKATSSDAYTLPLDFAIDATQFADECTVIDVNSDGVTWEWSNDRQTAFYYYNDYAAADDWLMLPVVDFGDAGGTLDLSIKAAVASYNFPESFEVCIGDDSSIGSMRPVLVCDDIINQTFDDYTAKVTLDTGGRKWIGIHATSKQGMYSLYVKDLSVRKAADMTPAAPELKEVIMSGLQGDFTIGMPTVTVDGLSLSGHLKLLTKVDGVVYSTTATEAGAELHVPVIFTLGRHTVTFAAESGEGTERLCGAETLYSLVASHPEGYAYALPFEMLPTQGEFDTFTILDANNDGNTWQYFSGTNAAMECKTTGDNPSDDWVFLPPLRVDDVSRIYNVSVEARAYLESYPESFDICVGTTADPASMTPVISRDRMTKYLYDNSITADWIAPAAGTYVIGIHRRSDGDAHTLRVRNVRVADSGRSVHAPAAVTSLSATAEATGQLRATVDFDMPALSVGGAPLAGDYLVHATVTSGTGATATATGLPGEHKSLTVAAPEGYSYLSVLTWSDADGQGVAAEVPVYCGLDIPAIPVVNVAEAEDNLSVTVTWTDADRGENGGPVNKSMLRHAIYEPIAGGLYWNQIAEIPAGTDSYTLEAEMLQNVTYIGVTAISDRGESQVGFNYAITGTPYVLPMADDLRDGVFNYEPVVIDAPDETYVSEWYLDYPSLLLEPLLSETDGQALMCVRAEDTPGTRGLLRLPKFTTRQTHATTVEMTYLDGRFAPEASVKVCAYGCEPVEIGRLPRSSSFGWRDISLPLPENLYGKSWAYLVIEPSFDAAPQMFVLRGYSVRNVYADDLEIAVYAPRSLSLGETAQVTVKVRNISDNTTVIPQIECIASTGAYTSELTAAADAPTYVEGGKTVSLTYTLSPVAELLGRCAITARFIDYTDEVEANNCDMAECEVSIGDALVVTDLQAEPNADNLVRLFWTEAKTDSSNELPQDYKIYRNGEEVGATAGALEYVDPAGRRNDHYHVAAVAGSTVHPRSNMVVIDFAAAVSELPGSSLTIVPGGIRVAGYAGHPLSVHRTDGVAVVLVTALADCETFALMPGVYVVTIGNETYKLTIK